MAPPRRHGRRRARPPRCAPISASARRRRASATPCPTSRPPDRIRRVALEPPSPIYYKVRQAPPPILQGNPMSIMPDKWIREMAQTRAMIEPFVEKQTREGVISYGLSSYGYDARVTREFKIFTNVDSAMVDPKSFSTKSFVDRETDICVVPPNSFALATTMEYFRIPRDVLVICLGKSTYARCGIIVNVTPLEPEWEGHVTIEISNTTPLPARIYAGEGVCQFLFFKSDQVCEVSYADRGGKYQKQRGVSLPKL